MSRAKHDTESLFECAASIPMEHGLGKISSKMFIAYPMSDVYDGSLENCMQALGRINVSAQAGAFMITSKLFR